MGIDRLQAVAANRARLIALDAPPPPVPADVADDLLRSAVCPKCGYDLNGLPSVGTCPECGRTYGGDEVCLYGFGAGRKASHWNRRPPTRARLALRWAWSLPLLGLFVWARAAVADPARPIHPMVHTHRAGVDRQHLASAARRCCPTGHGAGPILAGRCLTVEPRARARPVRAGRPRQAGSLAEDRPGADPAGQGRARQDQRSATTRSGGSCAWTASTRSSAARPTQWRRCGSELPAGNAAADRR